jgi:hypothetical protein
MKVGASMSMSVSVVVSKSMIVHEEATGTKVSHMRD